MNTSTRLGLTIALLALASASSPTFAQSSGGVKIEGNAEISATADDVTTVAEGGSQASSAIGAVRGDTTVSGDVQITANVDDVTTTAKDGSCAETAIGVVGTGPCN